MAKMVTVRGYWQKDDILAAVGEQADTYLLGLTGDGGYSVTSLGDTWVVRVLIRGGRIVSAK